MRLDDAAIERFSRQILLPEVGGLGQVRLLEARVVLAGDGPAAAVARDLLMRAGVNVKAEPQLGSVDVTAVVESAKPPPLVLPLVWGERRGARAAAATLVGQPCAACSPSSLVIGAAGRRTPRNVGHDRLLDDVAAQALGALAAAEVLALLLGVRTAGRLQWFDLAAAREGAEPLTGAGCDRCRIGE